jgi:EpsD family peptidyl-prolyl cis-trans isomerase
MQKIQTWGYFMAFISTRYLTVFVFVAASLMACSGRSDSKGVTQVAVKVNDAEISVHQINQVLQQSKVTAEQAPAARAQVLTRLIDQEVFVQRAMQQKIDRDPAVMMQVEAAKREILQRAYAEKIGSGVAKVTNLEIKDYYAQHPELFSQRRIFTYRVLAIQADKDQQSPIQEQLSKAKSLDEVISWLKEKNIRYVVDGATRSAEQIPMQFLPHLQQMKDGQVIAVSNPNALEVIQLLQSKAEPVAEDRAKQVIETFLTNQRKTELIQKEIADLRGKAKIEYMGDFKPAVGQSAPVASPVTAASSVPVSASSAVSATELNKGIAAGLH